jgi:hypothetical protein
MHGGDVSRTFEKLEIQKYEPPMDTEPLRQSHVPFSGSPCKHPHDSKKMILVTDPFSTALTYFEFNLTDVSFIEELPHLVLPEGEVVNMVRLWVRKGCIGVRCTPFIVEDTRIR